VLQVILFVKGFVLEELCCYFFVNVIKNWRISLREDLTYFYSKNRCSIPGKGSISCPNHPDRLWGPPSLLFNGCRDLSFDSKMCGA